MVDEVLDLALHSVFRCDFFIRSDKFLTILIHFLFGDGLILKKFLLLLIVNRNFINFRDDFFLFFIDYESTAFFLSFNYFLYIFFQRSCKNLIVFPQFLHHRCALSDGESIK